MAPNLDYDGGLTAALNVSDFDKSITWYQEVLGFQLLYRMDEMGWCELKTAVGGVNVGLSQVEEVKAGGGATLTFGVKDIDKARASLEDLGVRFDGETQVIPDMVKLATFFDPDNNALMLYENLMEMPG